MADRRPIGVFDSGVGGLTVARALIDLLPDERVVYFGDTARFPYGTKRLDEVRGYVDELVAWMIGADVKLIVAACNSATAAAVEPDDGVRPTAPVPVVGVIRPAVATAARATRNGRVGVIGTAATIRSRSYEHAFDVLASDVELFAQACPALVSYVEDGRTTDPEVVTQVRSDLAPLIDAHVDTMILGCTHYPLLTGVLSYVLGPDVLLISSAEETARRVVSRLLDDDLLSDHRAAAHRFVASGDPDEFRRLAMRFLGPRLAAVDVEQPWRELASS
ncbi:MAG: glutamate racemase [Actinobacteria bacterium]|nr:glutamate racemase [Actinomycetota bacterium]